MPYIQSKVDASLGVGNAAAKGGLSKAQRRGRKDIIADVPLPHPLIVVVVVFT